MKARFNTKGWHVSYVSTLLLLLAVFPAVAEELSPQQLFSNAVFKVASIVAPASNETAQAFSATIKMNKAAGVPFQIAGRSASLLFQAPDRLALSVEVNSKTYNIGRNGNQLWAHLPEKKWGVVGMQGVPRFKTAPEKVDKTELGPLRLPVGKEQLFMVAAMMQVEGLPAETIEKEPCHVVKAKPMEALIKLARLPQFEITAAIRDKDFAFTRITYRDGKSADVEVQFSDVQIGAAVPESRWAIPTREGDTVEKVALSHLSKGLRAAFATLTERVPTLPESTGERQIVAVEGRGHYEKIDGTRVLFLKGTPEEMGRQQGVLLKRHVRDLVDHILYGVGVGSSFDKGRWFFNTIESAESRLEPFMDKAYLQEMDAMASAAGLEREEVRLANHFPELFHCSGFALAGAATKDGRMFHGRILDYLRGMGLEGHAVVMVYRPEGRYGWVNVGYAGFIGSVTAMNEKHIAIGEMGGRGEGNWDGKPMAQLVREVMEKSATLEEAVEIMRKGPRTCEYYYVISDGNSKRAVGIAATPEKFEVVKQGEAHPRLPHAIKDVVLMSAGERYETLAKRVQEGYGKFDAASARELMTRPVAMKSNIHSVLFEPDTLDFWVANADSKNVASACRYTKYNLGELLKLKKE
jgi:outer membrane lipoprotein-sorting protein